MVVYLQVGKKEILQANAVAVVVFGGIGSCDVDSASSLTVFRWFDYDFRPDSLGRSIEPGAGAWIASPQHVERLVNLSEGDAFFFRDSLGTRFPKFWQPSLKDFLHWPSKRIACFELDC